MKSVAGGVTGRITVTWKQFGAGEKIQLIPEYRVDTMAKRDTRFRPGISGNEAAQWKPGQSGNLAGKSKQRTQFEEAFNEALITQGGPEEAARLLWEAARSKEPWAIQELCRRFAPQTPSLQLIHEVDNDKFDCIKLSDDQIEQIDAILEQAGAPLSPAEGEGAPKAA